LSFRNLDSESGFWVPKCLIQRVKSARAKHKFTLKLQKGKGYVKVWLFFE
jgi:hypothetical protein